MQTANSQPGTVDIRRFLTEAFSDEELSTLCFDYFRDVYDDFASSMTKGQRIQLLIECCERRGILPNLLVAIQKARPEQYQERFPPIPQAQAPPAPRRPERDPRQVFISHAHEDASFAHRLAADLQKRGWRVWIAPDSIRPGEKWAEAIDRGLAESSMFLVALTPAVVQSRWVRDETYVAVELEKKGRAHFVPLEVKPCEVPGLWSVHQRVSFSGDYAVGLRELLTALERAGQLPTGEPVALPGQPQRMDVPNLAKVSEPLKNPLLLWAGAGVVAVVLIVRVIVAISSRQGGATPAPPTLTSTNMPVAVSASTPTETSLPTVPVTPGKATATPGPTKPPPTTQPLTTVPAIGATRVSEKDGMVMVYVPAGEFLMGSADSDEAASSNEKPQHTVYLDAFWIDQTEVTNAQYNKCAQAGACTASRYASNSTYKGDDSQPVIGVDWNDATTYCQWAGRQLPTEAQWEKAARGTDGRIYPWGNQTATCEYAVMKDGSGIGCGKGETVWPVGSKLKDASPYGALDMAGNVYEWVADWYSGIYYTSSPARNPLGPSSGQCRVLRGGSFVSGAQDLRGAVRWGAPWRWNSNQGFRCACAPGSSSGC